MHSARPLPSRAPQILFRVVTATGLHAPLVLHVLALRDRVDSRSTLADLSPASLLGLPLLPYRASAVAQVRREPERARFDTCHGDG